MIHALLKRYIFESVIDASSRFMNKKKADARSKIAKASVDVMTAFVRQRDLEKFMRERLEDIINIPEKFLSKKRMQLSMPSLFADDDGWSFNTPLLRIVGTSGSDRSDRHFDELRRFIRENERSFTRVVASLDSNMKELENVADAIDWPAPWRRYTNYNEVWGEVQRFKEVVNKALQGG